MKTRQDAERVVQLCKERDAIHKLAAEIRTAEKIAAACTRTNTRVYHSEVLTFWFEHLAEELRDLVKREAAAQIATLDEELKVLGVVPDEFEAAAPAG
jgi:hypothetical protein